MQPKSENPKPEQLVVFDDDSKIIKFPASGWFANYTAIDSPIKLLKCIFYLSQKAWITNSHIYALIGGWEDRFVSDLDLWNFNAMD